LYDILKCGEISVKKKTMEFMAELICENPYIPSLKRLYVVASNK